jgi:hypothetical protein
MANLEKLKKRLDLMKQGKRFPVREGQDAFWKPKQDGTKSTIRLIHYPYSTEDAFLEHWFYYNVGTGPAFLAPTMYGKPDPVKDFAKTLWKSEDPKDRESAKQLSAKQRFSAIAVDRSDPNLVPKYWSFGKTVYEKLAYALLDREYAHYLDNDNGIDIDVWQVKAAGKQFANTEFQFKRKESPLASKEEIERILKAVTPQEEIFKQITTAEVMQRLEQWLSVAVDGSEEESSKESVRGGAAAEESDVDAEFERALNNANLD